jgi:hypothetical protein
MPTTTKTRKTKPAAKGQETRRFAGPGSARLSPPRHPQFPRPSARRATNTPSGLIGRARAKLPGRAPTPRKNDWKDALAGLGTPKHYAAGKSSRKGAVGIVMGAGLGAAAIVARRRSSSESETSTMPVSPVQASGQTESPIVAPVAPVQTGAADDPSGG